MLQTMTDEPRKRCPKCRCKVERLMGAGAGLIFKGSGFYITDYAKKDSVKEKSKEPVKSNGKSGSSSEKKSEKKSDTIKKSKEKD